VNLMKSIFRTGVVVLVLAIPEFLLLAVWLCVRQRTANGGVWASLLAVGMCLSTLRLFSESRPQASVTFSGADKAADNDLQPNLPKHCAAY
jgi:hypothetical protein